MEDPKFIVSHQKDETISIQRVVVTTVGILQNIKPVQDDDVSYLLISHVCILFEKTNKQKINRKKK